MTIIEIINLLHMILVVSLISSVFINNYEFKKIALTMLIFTFLQFITNYGKCGLTELEYLFKGEDYKEGFIYRLVKPVITVPEKYFDKYMHCLHTLWIIILWVQLRKIQIKQK